MPSPIRPLLACLLLASPTDPPVQWSAKEGSEVEWSWKLTQDLKARDIYLVTDTTNQNSSQRMSLNYLQLESKDTLELVVKDRLLQRDSTRPLRVERQMQQATRTTSASWGRQQATEDLETVSPLQDLLLELQWCEVTKDYVAEAPEEEHLEEHLLDGVREAVDLRGLLDEDSRELGDSWHLCEKQVWDLLRPMGELSFGPKESHFAGERDVAALGWLLGATLMNGEGKAWARAKYEARVWDGERTLARIRLRIDVESKDEVREALEKLVEQLGSGQDWLDVTRSIMVEHSLRLDGLLYWDLEAGRADSLNLTGHSTVQLELDLDLKSWGSTYFNEWFLVAVLHGELELDVSGT